MKITVDKSATTMATTIRKHRLKFSTPQTAIGSPHCPPPSSPFFLPFPVIMLTSTVSRHTFPPSLPPPQCPLTFQLPTSRTPVFALYRSLDCRLICSSPPPPPPFFLPFSFLFFFPLVRVSLRFSNDRFSIKPVIDKPPLAHGNLVTEK